MRTYTPKPGEVTRTWHVIDATDVVLGRLASQTAVLLRGKHKPQFAPHVDTGDFVIIINADKVALTGAKAEQKKAYRHSGFPGGLRSTSYTELLAKSPEKAVEKAIRGMLPKNTLARHQLSKLKVYRHSGFPGGLRSTSYTELLAKSPEKAVEKAIRGMLPKNTLARHQLSKLKVYRGAEHPHAAQQPVPFEITQVAQ